MTNRVEICGVNTSELKVLTGAEKEDLLKKIKDGDHLQSLQDGFCLFCCYEIVPDCLQLRDIIFHQAEK